MKKIILLALGLLVACIEVPAVDARTVQADRPVVYSTSTGSVRYWNGSTLTQIATNGYGLSYYQGKFIWWNDTNDRFDFVTTTAPASVSTYATPVSLGTGTISPNSNAQWTPQGFVYIRNAPGASSELYFRSSSFPYTVTAFSGASLVPGLPYYETIAITNYRIGANGNMYLALQVRNAGAGSPPATTLRHTICEFRLRPFSLVSCALTGYDGMAQLDENEDGTYDSTVYFGAQSSGSGFYYTNGSTRKRQTASNSPLGRYFEFDVIEPDAILAYSRFFPVSSTGAFLDYRVSLWNLNVFAESFSGTYTSLGHINYCSFSDTNPCVVAGYPGISSYEKLLDYDSWPYYTNQWVDLFSEQPGNDPFSNPNTSGGSYTGSLTFDTEEQSCAPQYFSGATTTGYSYSGSLAADFSDSLVNGVYGFSGASQSYLYYGTGSELEPGWSVPHAILGIDSENPYYGELGILGAGMFRATGLTSVVYAAGTGAFVPHAFKIDNTALPAGTCGDLAVQYSYYNQSGVAVHGTMTVLASGSGTAALPGIRDRFGLMLSSSNGDACLDRLEIISGGVVPEETYAGDITRYACESSKYSCEWQNASTCSSSAACYTDGDYCRVRPEYLEMTSSGSYSYSYTDDLAGTYDTFDPSSLGSGTGGFAPTYRNFSGSYSAILPGTASGSCLMFETGALFSDFHYKYSNLLSFSFDVSNISGDSMFADFLGMFQKTFDTLASPINNSLSILLSVAPVADNTDVCYFGTIHKVRYQSMFDYGTGAVHPALVAYMPVKGKTSYFDYVALGIVALVTIPILLLPLYRFSS